MITKNSRIINGFKKKLAFFDQKIESAQADIAEIQQKIEQLTADKREYEEDIAELTSYEDLVSSMFNDCGNATLTSADLGGRPDRLRAQFENVDSVFAENVASKLGGTLQQADDGSSRVTGTYNGCEVSVRYYASDNVVIMIITSFSSLLTTSTNESLLTEQRITDAEVREVLRDAEDEAKRWGITDEFPLEYYIGNAVSAAGYHLDSLYRFFPDHIHPEDKEYKDAVRGWKENLGLDPDEDLPHDFPDNFVADDDF